MTGPGQKWTVGSLVEALRGRVAADYDVDVEDVRVTMHGDQADVAVTTEMGRAPLELTYFADPTRVDLGTDPGDDHG